MRRPLSPNSRGAQHEYSARSGLCNELTVTKTIYPGTNHTLVYSITTDH